MSVCPTYYDVLQHGCPQLKDLLDEHQAASKPLLQVPYVDSSKKKCDEFDKIVSAVSNITVPSTWLPFTSRQSNTLLRVPRRHFALPWHLRHDLPWLGRPCPFTGEPLQYGVVVCLCPPENASSSARVAVPKFSARVSSNSQSSFIGMLCFAILTLTSSSSSFCIIVIPRYYNSKEIRIGKSGFRGFNRLCRHLSTSYPCTPPSHRAGGIC
jgi:hypothetical protein